jgi:predicted NUDIX family phosphoesterase
MDHQLVLVCRASLLHELGGFQGYTLEVSRYLSALFSDPGTHFHNRVDAERDVRYKQFIPYVLLRSGNHIFTYVRGRTGAEERLRLQMSIGLGGHIEPTDAAMSDLSLAYRTAAAREVLEEVEMDGPYEERLIGLINDDTDHVGQVHLGILHIWDLANTRVRSREDGITLPKFQLLDTLVRSLSTGAMSLESWSRISLAALLDPNMPAPPMK